MGIEPYTINELKNYYASNIGGIDKLKLENIYLVNNLKSVVDKYNIAEETDNMNGFTVLLNEVIVAVRDQTNEFETMNALFHEFTHAHDFFEFSDKYQIQIKDIPKNYLYYSLQMYSEINAYYLGHKLTVQFLNLNNPLVKQMCCASMNPINDQMDVLGKKEILFDDIVRCIGYLLFYGYLYDTTDYLEYLPDFVSPRIRGLIASILDCYFTYNIEEINSIVSLLCH